MKDKKILTPEEFKEAMNQIEGYTDADDIRITYRTLEYADLHELAVKLAEMVGIYHPGCTNADCDACQLIDKLTAQQFRRAQGVKE